MKTDCITATLLLGLALGSGCSSHTDSTKRAETINDSTIDKQAVAASSDAKDKAKKMSEGMVQLTNTSRTEYELSKLAVQKATNPEVKAFAQQAVSDHGADNSELRDMARQMDVTLPADLSNKSKSRLSKLTDMRVSTAFDTQYLTDMAAVNDDALDAADALRSNAPTDAVKSFIRKMMADDKKHRETAKQLKNVLD